MAEDIGVGGRAGYYDGVGAARDVIQNHLLQLLALTAMEEPISLSAEHLRAEKEKVLAAVHVPEDLALATARGQYAGGPSFSQPSVITRPYRTSGSRRRSSSARHSRSVRRGRCRSWSG